MVQKEKNHWELMPKKADKRKTSLIRSLFPKWWLLPKIKGKVWKARQWNCGQERLDIWIALCIVRAFLMS